MSPTPPYLKRASNPDKGIAGRKAESNAAKRIGADLRPGSGAMDGAKGDYQIGEFLIENKTSMHASFSVRQEHFRKIYQEALERAMHPALAFQFVNAHGQSEKRDRWIAIPEGLFRQLIGE